MVSSFHIMGFQVDGFPNRYAQVDRRPLDPPPVVQLRIFKVQHTGTEKEVEKEVDYG